MIQPTQEEPRAWEWAVEGSGGQIFRTLTRDPETAALWQRDDTFPAGVVTPLYAGAPAVETISGPAFGWAEMQDMEDAGVSDGDTIRPPATIDDVCWLTRAYRSEKERQSAIRILAALRDTAPARIPREEKNDG